MKKILIINGHPNSDSFNFGLFESYKKGAVTAGADIKEIVIKGEKAGVELQFNESKNEFTMSMRGQNFLFTRE